MGTSKASPFATCFLVPSPEPKVALTLWPVFFSKSGINCSTAERLPDSSKGICPARDGAVPYAEAGSW